MSGEIELELLPKEGMLGKWYAGYSLEFDKLDEKIADLEKKLTQALSNRDEKFSISKFLITGDKNLSDQLSNNFKQTLILQSLNVFLTSIISLVKDQLTEETLQTAFNECLESNFGQALLSYYPGYDRSKLYKIAEQLLIENFNQLANDTEKKTSILTFTKDNLKSLNAFLYTALGTIQEKNEKIQKDLAQVKQLKIYKEFKINRVNYLEKLLRTPKLNQLERVFLDALCVQNPVIKDARKLYRLANEANLMPTNRTLQKENILMQLHNISKLEAMHQKRDNSKQTGLAQMANHFYDASAAYLKKIARLKYFSYASHPHIRAQTSSINAPKIKLIDAIKKFLGIEAGENISIEDIVTKQFKYTYQKELVLIIKDFIDQKITEKDFHTEVKAFIHKHQPTIFSYLNPLNWFFNNKFSRLPYLQDGLADFEEKYGKQLIKVLKTDVKEVNSEIAVAKTLTESTIMRAVLDQNGFPYEDLLKKQAELAGTIQAFVQEYGSTSISQTVPNDKKIAPSSLQSLLTQVRENTSRKVSELLQESRGTQGKKFDTRKSADKSTKAGLFGRAVLRLHDTNCRLNESPLGPFIASEIVSVATSKNRPGKC